MQRAQTSRLCIRAAGFGRVAVRTQSEQNKAAEAGDPSGDTRRTPALYGSALNAERRSDSKDKAFIGLDTKRGAALSVRELFEKARDSYLVDPASSHMLVSKIKPCKCKYELKYSETANGSLKKL